MITICIILLQESFWIFWLLCNTLPTNSISILISLYLANNFFPICPQIGKSQLQIILFSKEQNPISLQGIGKTWKFEKATIMLRIRFKNCVKIYI